MPTPYSSSTPNPYATPADLMARKDVRRLGDLVGDADVRVTAGGLGSNVNLQTCLDDAAGLVEAACLVGQRYAPADLVALAGVSQMLLKRVVCDLAWGFAAERRYPEEAEESFARAERYLKDLRRGEMIFGLLEQVQASTEVPVDLETPTTSGQVPVSQRASRFFGRRGNNTTPGWW